MAGAYSRAVGLHRSSMADDAAGADAAGGGPARRRELSDRFVGSDDNETTYNITIEVLDSLIGGEDV